MVPLKAASSRPAPHMSRCCWDSWRQGSSGGASSGGGRQLRQQGAAPTQFGPVARVQAAAGQDAPPMPAQQQQQQPQQPPPAPLPPAPLPPLNRSFFDVMRFNGPGPELINGRLAMIGILAAARGEALSGDTALAQAQALAATPSWAWAGLALVVYASLVPMLKGARHEAFGIFTPRAEVTNGRAAMLGFAILLALEYKAGVPFF